MEQEYRPILVTVIVPIYNTMEYLQRCVDSIRRQSYPYLEILLVDDGSTDNSGALAEKFAMEDRRIKVFHKENGGSSSARNLGIQKAGGDYIGFVDSDDYIEPGMIERLLKLAVEEELPMVQCSRDEIDENGQRLEDVCVPPEKVVFMESSDFMEELLLHRGDSSFCTKLTQAALFKEHRFPEGELNEDFRLLIELLPEITAVGILPEQDYHVVYRYGSNSRTRDKNEFPRVFTDIVVNADRAEKLVEQHYPELQAQARRFALCQRLDYMLHIPIARMNKENSFYMQVWEYLKQHRVEIRTNPYLTDKNRRYLKLLSAAPAQVRRLHALKMKLQGKG